MRTLFTRINQMTALFGRWFHGYLLVAVLLLTSTAVLASDNQGGHRVFQVELDSPFEQDINSDPLKDFYISGGADDGLKEEMLLDVYREKRLQGNLAGEEYRIRILVGQLKVFRLFQDVAVTRIFSLSASSDSPILQYRTVMVGDYAVPRNQLATKGSSEKLASSDASSPAIILPSEVLFPHDEWTLKAAAKDVLRSVNTMFNQLENSDIVVGGHTSGIGSEEYNLELSKKRAQAVADYLIQTNNYPEGRVRFRYFGESFPVASNDSEQGRAMNRRVTITFLPRG